MENVKSKPMNIENAINRISWRFKNGNIKINESKITINQTDVDSVDFIIKWIDNQKNNDLQNNLLFAKLYCYCLTHEIEFYKDIKFANGKIANEIKKPITQHYDSITESLNRLELNTHLSSLGIVTDHIEKSLLKEYQEQEQQKLIHDNQQSISKFVIGAWTSEKVYRSLNNVITECINKFKNHK